MTTPSTPARVEGTIDPLLACIPSNWLDPMLTGPQRVIGEPPYDCRDIERVLLAVRYRIEAHLKAIAECSAATNCPKCGVCSPRCCDCKYYQPVKSQCRRYPPTFTGTMHDTVSPKVDFPEVLPTKDWCGEFTQQNAALTGATPNGGASG